MFVQAIHAQEPKKEKQPQKQESSWTKDANFKDNTVSVYFPEQDVYYNVSKKTYTYKKGKEWTESKDMPKSMQKADLKSAKKVEIDKKDDVPTATARNDKKKNTSKEKSGKQERRR